MEMSKRNKYSGVHNDYIPQTPENTVIAYMEKPGPMPQNTITELAKPEVATVSVLSGSENTQRQTRQAYLVVGIYRNARKLTSGIHSTELFWDKVEAEKSANGKQRLTAHEDYQVCPIEIAVPLIIAEREAEAVEREKRLAGYKAGVLSVPVKEHDE